MLPFHGSSRHETHKVVWTWRVVWEVSWRWSPAIPGGHKPEPGPLLWGPAWNQVGEAVKVGCPLDRKQSPLVRCPSNLIHTDSSLTHGKSIHQGGTPISVEFKFLFSSLSSPGLGVGSREGTGHTLAYSSVPTQTTHMLDGEGAPS